MSISLPKLLFYSILLVITIKGGKTSEKLLEKELQQRNITKKEANLRRAEFLIWRMDKIEKEWKPMRDPVIELVTAFFLIIIFLYLPSSSSQDGVFNMIGNIAWQISGTLVAIAWVLRRLGIRQMRKDSNELLRLQSGLTQ